MADRAALGHILAAALIVLRVLIAAIIIARTALRKRSSVPGRRSGTRGARGS